MKMALAAFFQFALLGSATAADLPAGFVRLADVDPTIRQDMRYAGSLNFLGRPAKGYDAPVCIVTDKAARALAKAQALLMADGLTLVMFDCYRPRRAVADFVDWAGQSDQTDARWHPSVARRDLLPEGYIARRSGHSRGSTVDLGIAPVADPATSDVACGALAETLDFGTGFDCLDPLSRTASKTIGAGAQANRRMLVDAMRSAGFTNYSREWWHFTLAGEPFKQGFDFPVTE